MVLSCWVGVEPLCEAMNAVTWGTVLARHRLDVWSVRWVENQLIGHTQEGGDQRVLLRLAAYHKWGPPGSSTRLHTAQHFHTMSWKTRLKAPSPSLLMRLSWMVWESYPAERPGQDENRKEFNTDTPQVLHLSQNNWRVQHRLDSVWPHEK